ncbi:BEL1-like homeodomain protein 9 [Zea mays]|uniref:Homeobox domain-containing protein n=1 Tax=Zea mays TaxID=4577 RepID=C0P859_MAIZE|eukprot:NP_001168681.1 putative POX domain/homeobox DNA-binding domain family protein [Zea mays]
MSSAAGGGYGAGGAEHQHLLLGQAAGAGQLYHVPQHSRREKLRFPPDDAADSPPPTAWPAPPPFYSYASSSTSSYYSPHSPTLAHAQLVAHALPAGAGVQIPSQNFALSLSSAPSNPPPAPRRQLAAGVATGPYGPFTGYAAVLGRSRFLGPAQKLLEEICNVGGRPPHLDPLSDEGMFGMEHGMGGVDRATAEAVAVSGAEQQWRKTRLISLMEDVCRRYKQYYQQLQSVISSFETVSGLSNAVPFASMALRTMSKHFKFLKGMIMSQLRNTSKVAASDGIGKDDMANFALMGGGADHLRGNSVNTFSQAHNIWRPQRGLPERAVSVLRSWLFEHFLHPYPTDSDKQMLAKQTGLTRNQVSNWFINARVRLWKPMVEEIHNLEMRQQLQKNTSAVDKTQLGMQQLIQHSSANSRQRGQSSGGTTRNQDELPPRMPHDMAGQGQQQQQQVSFAYAGLPAHHHGLALSHPQQQAEAVSAVGGGVSLTLGLHQNNNRTYVAEPLPAALPHRFGLEDVSDAYVMQGTTSFGGQDRHFGKGMGGHHFVHDLVG